MQLSEVLELLQRHHAISIDAVDPLIDLPQQVDRYEPQEEHGETRDQCQQHELGADPRMVDPLHRLIPHLLE